MNASAVDVDDLQPRARGPERRADPFEQVRLAQADAPWITSGLNADPAVCDHLQRRGVGQAVARAGHEVLEPPRRAGRRRGRGAGEGRSADGRGAARGGRRPGPWAMAGSRADSSAPGRVDDVADRRRGLVVDPEGQPERPAGDRLGRRRRGCPRSAPAIHSRKKALGTPTSSASPADAQAGPPRRTRARTAPRPAARPPHGGAGPRTGRFAMPMPWVPAQPTGPCGNSRPAGDPVTQICPADPLRSNARRDRTSRLGRTGRLWRLGDVSRFFQARDAAADLQSERG